MNKKQTTLKQIATRVRRHLLQQQQSSLTIKAYCEKHHISAQTFYGWRKRYGKRLFAENRLNAVSSGPKVSFTSIGTLNTSLNKAVLFDIRFSGGTTVTIYPGTTAEVLAPFLSLLSGDTRLC